MTSLLNSEYNSCFSVVQDGYKHVLEDHMLLCLPRKVYAQQMRFQGPSSQGVIIEDF
jgi:hypothetical protein